jgi:hypothetical protein
MADYPSLAARDGRAGSSAYRRFTAIPTHSHHTALAKLFDFLQIGLQSRPSLSAAT